MLGTDLNQAYEQIPSSQNFNNGFQFNEEIPDKIQTEQVIEPVRQNEPITSNEQIPNQPTHIYDSTSMFKEIQMNDQIMRLQNQIKQHNNNNTKQEQTHTSDVYQQDSVIDRYISKKKDVMKLVIMSFTVLLGLSLHYLITDIVRNYIASNDLTMNQEFFTKCAYPVTIVLLIWTLKVFNR